MNKLIKLSDIAKASQSLVGNKAYRLSLLNQAGIKTSDFFVIPTSITNIDNAITQEINNYLAVNPDIHYAVRSSATCEDGSSASFAGQFTSYLSLTAEEVILAIKKVWESAQSETIKEYCSYHNIDLSVIKMAVIVQQMVSADKGGVVFTRDVFQDRNLIVIEAAKGLGEQVVSGVVDSDKYVLDKKQGKVLEGVLGFQKSILSKSEVRQIWELALRVEKLLGSPQDIEWAIQGKQLYILQTRPIT